VFTKAQLNALDKELNETYRLLKASADPKFREGTVTWVDIREAQRAWLDYRDAWIKFGKVRYPAISEPSWKAFFTEQRLKMLKELLGE
jgi:uncharacterized protein YecT (DUF1311 family)